MNFSSARSYKTAERYRNLQDAYVVLIDGTSLPKLLWDLGTIQVIIYRRDKVCILKTIKELKEAETIQKACCILLN